MKAIRSIVAFLLFAAAFGGALWFGLRSLKPDDKEEASAPAGKDAPGEKKSSEPGVQLDEATQRRIGLEVEELKAASLKPELASHGRVIDPSPLVALDGELNTVETALDASSAADARARSLFQNGENVARKQIETTEAQFRTDQTHAQGLRRRLAMEWGEAISQLDTAGRAKLIDQLARFESVLLRVDVAAGETLEGLPKAARIFAIGRDSRELTAAAIFYSTYVDPKTQTLAFLLRVDHPPFPLRPGTSVTAFLELPGDSLEGVVIPRSAIVYSEGEAWAYVQEEGGRFERRRIAQSRPAAAGVFVSKDFKPGEKVVTVGAQTLLSEETKSAGGGEAD